MKLMHIVDDDVAPSGFTMLYLLAEISANDGAAVMVDEFSRKMKGWWSESVSYQYDSWYLYHRYLGRWCRGIEVTPQKRIQIPRLVHDVISMIDV
jgi:hypothetical protein